MEISSQTGLVLEGDGMRAISTVGVLDYFVDRGIWFSYTIEVPAGTSSGVLYTSHQRRRSRFNSIDLLKEYNCIGLRHLLRGKGYIDLNLLFYVCPNLYCPLDYDTYFKSKDRFVMITNNCLTGKTEYFEEKKNRRCLTDIYKAPCTLPVLCLITHVDGIPVIDGGICDAISVRRAIVDGSPEDIIVLTCNGGYQKGERGFHLPGFIYNKYSATREQLRLRYRRYDEVLDYIDQPEVEGKASIIRPRSPIKVGRTGSDTKKLEELRGESYGCRK